MAYLGNTIVNGLLRAINGIYASGDCNISGTLTLSKDTDTAGAANNKPALIVGGTDTTAHIEIDGNEIMAKSSGTATGPLYLNNDGGNVYVNNKLVSLDGHIHSYLPLTGGRLTNTLHIRAESSYGAFNEGIRIEKAPNNWATIMLGTNVGSTSGSGATNGGWFIAQDPSGNFQINRSNSTLANAGLWIGTDSKVNVPYGLVGNSTSSSYPEGFNQKFVPSTSNWSTIFTSIPSDCTAVTGWSTSSGAALAILQKSGQLYIATDGWFYQDEGRYKCLDTSSTLDATKLSGTIPAACYTHTHNYAGSSSAGGAATSIVTTSITADADKNIYFVNGSNTVGYNANLVYNPSVNLLKTKSIGTTDSHLFTFVDGGFYSGDGTVTGALCITLPVSWSATMMSFQVTIYNYVDNDSTVYFISGYNYTGGDGYWVSCSAHAIGKRILNVRFGHNGTKCVVIIGETNTTWSYPKLVISNLLIGHSGVVDKTWCTGWNITPITTLPSTIHKIIDPGINLTRAMTAATANAAGLTGLVPAPAAGKQTSFLRGDGTWVIPTDTVYTHPNTVTAGTVGTSAATSGSTLAVPYVTYNANGHVTATGTHTHTISGFLPSTGGTLTNQLIIQTTANNSYNEGIRINKSGNNWAGLIIGGNANTTSGTPSSNGGWFVAQNNSNQFIVNNVDSSTTNASIWINTNKMVNCPGGITANLTGTASKATLPVGFDHIFTPTTSNWAGLINSTPTDATNVTAWETSGGACIAFREKSGNLYVGVDGYFVQNQGQYQVLDTSSSLNAAKLTGTITIASGLSWPGGTNISCTSTANGQEWSIDMVNTTYTGTYWHVWSGKTSKSCIQCYNDNCNVTVPNGTFTASKDIVMNGTNGTNYLQLPSGIKLY